MISRWLLKTLSLTMADVEGMKVPAPETFYAELVGGTGDAAGGIAFTAPTAESFGASSATQPGLGSTVLQ